MVLAWRCLARGNRGADCLDAIMRQVSPVASDRQESFGKSPDSPFVLGGTADETARIPARAAPQTDESKNCRFQISNLKSQISNLKLTFPTEPRSRLCRSRIRQNSDARTQESEVSRLQRRVVSETSTSQSLHELDSKSQIPDSKASVEPPTPKTGLDSSPALP